MCARFIACTAARRLPAAATSTSARAPTSSNGSRTTTPRWAAAPVRGRSWPPERSTSTEPARGSTSTPESSLPTGRQGCGCIRRGSHEHGDVADGFQLGLRHVTPAGAVCLRRLRCRHHRVYGRRRRLRLPRAAERVGPSPVHHRRPEREAVCEWGLHFHGGEGIQPACGQARHRENEHQQFAALSDVGTPGVQPRPIRERDSLAGDGRRMHQEHHGRRAGRRVHRNLSVRRRRARRRLRGDVRPPGGDRSRIRLPRGESAGHFRDVLPPGRPAGACDPVLLARDRSQRRRLDARDRRAGVDDHALRNRHRAEGRLRTARPGSADLLALRRRFRSA